MRVLKFGGTSVANAERLKQISEIISSKFNDGDGLCVVVSAFSGVTDLLIKAVNLAEENNNDYRLCLDKFIQTVHDIATSLLPTIVYASIKAELNQNHENLSNLLTGVSLIQEASNKSKDFVVSFGERNCAFILTNYLNSINLPTEYIDARKLIKTNSLHDKAIVDYNISNDLITNRISDNNKIYIITGFIASDVQSTTTLGRGGSDFTAAIFTAALKADELEIWTDVNGVLTTNPKKVKKAYTIPELSYKEAAEMSHFGAKVLYNPTIKPVKDLKIPIRIKNTFDPENEGTIIHANKTNTDRIISGLSSINNVALLSLQGSGMQGIPGIAYRFFKCLAHATVNIIMITQASSEHSITVAINDIDQKEAKQAVEEEFSLELERKVIEPVNISSNISLVAIIGENMKDSPGVAGKLFHTLGKNNINIEAIAQGSSELNITFAINERDESKALNSLHDSFFLSETKSIHLFIIGVGLIGSTLLDQINSNLDDIKKDSRIELIVNGVANSKRMVFSEDGIHLSKYKSLLDESEEASDINLFIDKMIEANYAHSIFVDNTASKIIPEQYSRILENNIAISTPNKIALSSGYRNYQKLKGIANRMSIPFNFETNVGAGLPVISTIKNLTSSGDSITSIEAVLSGSLSFIFNNFNSDKDFLDVVKEAQQKGYTEPDPRDDLSGSDVKRKLLILARESGIVIEDEEIEMNSLLSDDALEASSVDKFFDVLKAETENYKNLILEAEAKNERLRFIASYKNGKGAISLLRIDSESPFYSLSGSDNMIVIRSKRYNETPLVIRGPGAGASVTAAGILSEIISISALL